MKALAINKQTIHYALFKEVADKLADGLKTGEKVKTYYDPVAFRANVSAARGTADTEQFGISDDYERTICTSDMTCPIAEDSILWVGVPVTDPYNYKVVKVARSLNSIVYAIKKVTVR